MFGTNRKVFVLISFGFFVHGLVLKAAFDIYFSSPIDNGMTPILSTNKPPAKRLVLFVADGLRAEGIFGENQTENAPNLNKIKQTRGSWGIAHTRVPTESRPGHVALLGGIYEDPSALLKGWKVNPVDFDSVINQSRNAWCWGGPSIINMFNKDDLPHIHLHSYDSSLEDFGNNNTIGLDLWVFDEVNSFIQQQKTCDVCEFKQTGNLFFLHLLGIDTAGHAFKPNSLEYKKNIRFVDENIVKIEHLFETIFPDKSTSYVFTADHGMTNWGSHGSGSDHETTTPLIAWGAGIKIEKKRKDVQQIDIAPLLSALIGINYPINSLGRLPVDYLATSLDNLAQMMISNVLQLVETFNIKRNRRMRNAIRFVPFQGVTTQELESRIAHLKHLSSLQQFDSLKTESEKLIEFLIEGSDYYHNYYQLPILVSITVGIVAWIVYLATFNVRVSQNTSRRKITIYFEVLVFVPLYLNVLYLLIIQSLPLMYYVYFMFPIFMVQILVRRHVFISEALRQVKSSGFRAALGQFVVYLIGLRLLVQGFHNRKSLSIVMYLVLVSVFYSKSLRHTSRYQKTLWTICCVSVSLFPFLPEMTTTFNTTSYLLGYILWCMAACKLISCQKSSKVISVQFGMVVLTPLYTLSVEKGLVTSDSPLKNFALIWSLAPIVAILFSPIQIFSRLCSIFIGFGTFYLMVTSNYENLFLFFYVCLLYVWLILESRLDYKNLGEATFERRFEGNTSQSSDDFRRAFFFVVLIFIGFFGTGNIASLNSFDPMWVRCFLTIFSPFKMAGLILLRIIVPFLFTSCAYRAVNLLCKSNTLNMFCIVLMFSDLMLLELLYYITNIGSWLEIGMSLSKFIIMEAFVIIILILYGFAYLLTSVKVKL
ncbi:GPI ethanolamine phosphate transferase 1 [Tribolium castaneum]|uniref:GPI ethanolamine phosphate transferase 1 n=1 Tax=Tribolium castaneum TaxID=7070 RepID=A0A139WPE3_TRICA|nr:PREDICTED: GPI ethanolamine phosphate transferase 1 [Tribolium castaneum]KYB29869.1 GPI ethanolamine phosphate transferase 1-like Protein [Tribolium castaneum]|eukprot:XP_008199035.1 PREDICTED: GPI ethanolamine phosphate transferase 1 [Tribolium castaneum]